MMQPSENFLPFAYVSATSGRGGLGAIWVYFPFTHLQPSPPPTCSLGGPVPSKSHRFIFFVLFKRHPPSLQRPVCNLGLALVDAVHRISGRPSVSPRSGVAAAAGRSGTDQAMSAGSTLVRPVWVHPGDVHFSRDQCHHPLSYIP